MRSQNKLMHVHIHTFQLATHYLSTSDSIINKYCEPDKSLKPEMGAGIRGFIKHGGQNSVRY